MKTSESLGESKPGECREFFPRAVNGFWKEEKVYYVDFESI
ncbi:MAG: hypothetical protein ACQKBT_11385 [Puniceicoccales bacterium]